MANCRTPRPCVGKLSRGVVWENSGFRSKPPGSWGCPKQMRHNHVSSSTGHQRRSWTDANGIETKSHSNFGDSGGIVAVEEAELVAVLREAHPYVKLHRDSKFVVMLSAELLDSGSTLDGILKVITIYSFHITRLQKRQNA
ncbi:putative amino-acid N-acetyltransferase [Arabidopsis thaliana]|uniref:Uncharacterized protein n=3 Tax=Arabidopsis TaxID=3701 RepID=A0A178VR94_ARATH|nr:hypothetical protein ISN45_At02g016800 [Arabidopsis thaliana x Arabidopsis arenosa]KAG7641732.1 hypothetical protein ISN44_As02g017260 [Arabidopsis suecica]OAP08960.1 hypothetical protein AXX17_AT2G18530 [Arabidopsis thaliana]